jgi:hypothetical protein
MKVIVPAEIVVAGGPIFFSFESTPQYPESTSGMRGSIFTEVSTGRKERRG